MALRIPESAVFCSFLKCLSNRTALPQAYIGKPTAGPFYSIYPISTVQSILNGMTKIRAGIKSTRGTDLMRETRKPAAMVKMPPQAERSANMVGVSTVDRPRPAKNTISKITHWGSGMAQMAAPKVDAKISAVKPSSTALDISRLGSPVMPSVRVLYHPKPLQQNSATAVM